MISLTPNIGQTSSKVDQDVNRNVTAGEDDQNIAPLVTCIESTNQLMVTCRNPLISISPVFLLSPNVLTFSDHFHLSGPINV